MRCEAKTEEEMRAEKVPTPKSCEDLQEYIESLVDREHDYGTAAYAASLAATATFRFVAGQLGLTGFQASCADLDILRRTRLVEGPFAIVWAHDMAYPQYDVLAKVKGYMGEWGPWVSEYCRKKLNPSEDDPLWREGPHPEVKAHWEMWAARHPEESPESTNQPKKEN